MFTWCGVLFGSHLNEFFTDLYMSPAERLVVFDLWGLGSPARFMSAKKLKERKKNDIALPKNVKVGFGHER